MTANEFPADYDDFEDDFEDAHAGDWDDDEEEAEDDLDLATPEARHRNGYYARALHELGEGYILDDEISEIQEDAEHKPTWSVETLLQRLIAAPEEAPPNEYFALSDLTREQAEIVRRVWPEIDLASRRRALDIVIQGKEEFLDVDLGVFLTAILDDPDAEMRELVLETLGDNGPTPEMLGPIIQRLLHDQAEAVRAAAAAALGHYVLAGELDELDAALAMRAETVLVTILTDPAEPIAVQRRALESIAYSGEIGVRQFIEDAYYSPYEELRIGALVAMGRSADVRWRRLVRAELRNPSALMRAEAALACGELEAKAALPDLLALLEDSASLVRLAAIFALGRLGGKLARRPLEEIAAGDAEEAQAAEMALEEMLFFAAEDAPALPLFDESEEEASLDDLDPWDDWSDDDDDDDLGEYA
ncbi:HEAT repeat domain-containing protein [Caldilinea sp.]|uniref:HEAT repeat domain-containing protein n=1 Tax=Caldilinea sp. TaxID=2293560 RepID=UPI002C799580|nr:HEAT repeat domain-containing protein [Anaerolineales bacterium]HQY90122.1 HEAT repeat domain-containing protein [Caldilinea sp.]